MNLRDTEQALLATLLVDRGAKDRVRAELTADKFSFGPAEKFSKSHQKIYSAMIKCNGRVDVVTVSNNLGDDLESSGGQAYLQYLATACLQQLGVRSTEGLPQWVRVIDAAGRLRQLGELVEKYQKMYEDFQLLLDQVGDVDLFVADFQERVSKIALGGTADEYNHVSAASSVYRRILEDEANGIILSFYPMGWPSFESFAIPPQSELMVISGLSGIGKTQLMLQIALGVAIQIKAQGLPGCVAINSYEMTEWRCTRRLAACLAGVDYQGNAVRNKQSSSYATMMNVLEFIDTLPIYFDTTMTIPQISMNCAKMSSQGKPVVFLGIDYAEEVPEGEKHQSEELRVSSIFRGSKRMAVALGMCSCVLSQVSDVAAFPNAIVPYNRLRYSRAGTNAAGVIVYVYNPPQMKKMNIHFTFAEELGDDGVAYALVQKNRDGRVGAFPLEWRDDITRFRDTSLMGFGVTQLYRNLDTLGFINGRFEEDF